MIFRNSKKSDTDAIMHILAEARESIGKLGIDQWQYGYPTRDIIAEDINLGRSYVCDDNGVCAVFSVIYDGEPTYDEIFDGSWLTKENQDGDCDYLALHRIAVSNKLRGSGLASRIINFIKSLCIEHGRSSIRVDTHRGNLPMRRMLEKNGFEYCGVIYLTDGQERVAYELIVGEESKCTIYDITAELLSAPVYSGDTAPAVTRVRSICQGQRANTSDLTMCAHNGTHIDAPLHFVDDSYGIDKIPLEKCVGVAYVVSAEGDIDCDFINQYVPFDCRKLLIKGNAHFLPETAELLAKRGIHLVGVEDQSISSCEVTAVTHTAFLKKEIVLLEGIVLSDVADGKYDLCALPLKIAGIDGAPCRAILIKK